MKKTRPCCIASSNSRVHFDEVILKEERERELLALRNVDEGGFDICNWMTDWLIDRITHFITD